MSEKTKLSDYTENEFLALIIEIHRANLEEPDHVLGGLLDHFQKSLNTPQATIFCTDQTQRKMVNLKKY